MKKHIRNGMVLTTAVAVAMSTAACSSNEPQVQEWTANEPTAVCTDQQGRRVDDDLCDDDDARSGGGGFMFLYLGSGSHVPRYGAPVKGGSKFKAPGQSYTPSKSAPAARGGLGASSRGGGGFSSGS